MDSKDVDRIVAQLQDSTDRICAAILAAAVMKEDDVPEGRTIQHDQKAKFRFNLFLEAIKQD